MHAALSAQAACNPAAAGLGTACSIAAQEMERDLAHVKRLSDRLYNGITSQLQVRCRAALPAGCICRGCSLQQALAALLAFLSAASVACPGSNTRQLGVRRTSVNAAAVVILLRRPEIKGVSRRPAAASLIPHPTHPHPTPPINPPMQGVVLNGDSHARYWGNINLSFAYVEGESLLMGLKVGEGGLK